MLNDRPVDLTLTEYIVFMAVIALVLALLIRGMAKRERRARKLFFSLYHPTELRMSPYRIGLVDRLISETGETAQVLPIWDRDKEIESPKEISLPVGDLVPFDPDRFM